MLLIKAPEFYLRFAIPADKTFFQDHKDLYQGVIVNTRLLEAFPKSTAAFLNTLGKSFIIDPDTYVFKLDPSMLKRKRDFKLKRSYSQIGSFYNSVITKCVEEDRPLYPSDFLDAEGKLNAQIIDDFSSRIIRYEKTRIESLIGGLLKYIQEVNVYPKLLMAPYFDSSSIRDPWYRISLELAKSSVKYKDKYQLYPVICIDKSILIDNSSVNRVVQDYSFEGFDGYFIWFPDFNEEEENLDTLTGYAQLVSNLSKKNKPIIGMYGGFFSALLFYLGMTGFSSGMLFWNKRSLEITIGGPPYSRYYVPYLHSFLPWENVARLFSEDNTLVCRCPVCKSALKGYGPSMEELKRHFLYTRYSELVNIGRKTKEAMAKQILKDYSNKKPTLGLLAPMEHLRRWSQAIQLLE